MDAEQEDASHGIASVVEDQTTALPQTAAAEAPTPEPVEAAVVTQTESTSTAEPTTEGGA